MVSFKKKGKIKLIKKKNTFHIHAQLLFTNITHVMNYQVKNEKKYTYKKPDTNARATGIGIEKYKNYT